MADLGTPSVAEANAYLALFAVAPGLLFTGLNGSKDPASAQALVQTIWKLSPSAHVHPRLTDITWLVKAYNSFLLASQKYTPGSTPYNAYVKSVFDDEGQDRASEAKRALTTLRENPAATTNVIRALHTGDSQSLRDSVKNARWLAGEAGPDPILDPIIGSVVQNVPLPPPPPPVGAFPWLLAGGIFAAVGVAAVYALSKIETHEASGAHASGLSSGAVSAVLEGAAEKRQMAQYARDRGDNEAAARLERNANEIEKILTHASNAPHLYSGI